MPYYTKISRVYYQYACKILLGSFNTLKHEFSGTCLKAAFEPYTKLLLFNRQDLNSLNFDMEVLIVNC
jgi:hypothetical protein